MIASFSIAKAWPHRWRPIAIPAKHLFVVSAALLSAAGPAMATICLQSTIEIVAQSLPNSLSSGSENVLFDGSVAYKADDKIGLNDLSSPGEQALVFSFGMTLLSETTFELFYENDQANGATAQSYADALVAAGLGAWYWDHDNNGILDGADFDLSGDGEVDLGSGDFSPLGLVVELYDGDPGDPVGTGPGNVVHTAHSPIRQIESLVYSFSVTAPAQFDHVVIQSLPDGGVAVPNVVEIRHNGNANAPQGAIYGSGVGCTLSTEAAL